MGNKVIWKDNVKGYDVCAAQTDYGAIIMTASHRVFNGVYECQTWLGGIRDLSHAKELCLVYIDKDIVFEQKKEKAQKAYDANKPLGRLGAKDEVASLTIDL